MSPYEVLGVNRTMSFEQIRQAYHKKAKENHPDKKGDPEIFKKINNAFNDIEKERNGPPQSARRPPQHPFNGFPFHHMNMNMFRQINITLEDVYFGFSKVINGVNVNIPPGIDQNSTVKIPGTPLILKFLIVKHNRFEHKGRDLYLTKSVHLVEALTGYIGTIEHFRSKKIDIQTQPGEVLHESSEFVLKGQGLPLDKDARRFGDLIIKFKVQLPSSFPEKNHEAIKYLFDFKSRTPPENAITIKRKN